MYWLTKLVRKDPKPNGRQTFPSKQNMKNYFSGVFLLATTLRENTIATIKFHNNMAFRVTQNKQCEKLDCILIKGLCIQHAYFTKALFAAKKFFFNYNSIIFQNFSFATLLNRPILIVHHRFLNTSDTFARAFIAIVIAF